MGIPSSLGISARTSPPRGVNLLIEAFTRLDAPARLKIYGRSNGQSTVALKQMAARSRNSIEFCGEYMNHELVERVFEQVDCIVVPSIWAENSPLVIHEAQACRVPVITADYGGMAEYVQHGVNGLSFRHRDADSLAEQMAWAVAHPEEMIQLGERGYLYSESGDVVSIQAHCEQLLKIFHDELSA